MTIPELKISGLITNDSYLKKSFYYCSRRFVTKWQLWPQNLLDAKFVRNFMYRLYFSAVSESFVKYARVIVIGWHNGVLCYFRTLGRSTLNIIFYKVHL